MQKMNVLRMKKSNQKCKVNKIKSESGVTLITLVIMVVVVLILALASIYAGGESMQDIVERQNQSTLNMIQEIVISQYSKAHALKQTGISITESIQPSSYYGDCIKTEADYEAIVFPTDANEFVSTTKYMSDLQTYDDCYYRLTQTDLKNLGITDATENNDSVHSYIVKYSTGEVYDETLAESKYYIRGNKNVQNLVEDMTNKVETTDFND